MEVRSSTATDQITLSGTQQKKSKQEKPSKSPEMEKLLQRDDVQLAECHQDVPYNGNMTVNLELFLSSKEAQKEVSKLIQEAV